MDSLDASSEWSTGVETSTSRVALSRMMLSLLLQVLLC
jgi:hypothetical protein